MIDASTEFYGEKISKTVKRLTDGYVDYVVATHLHDDHIGGMADILSEVSVGQLLLLKDEENSSLFQDLILSARNSGAEIRYAETEMTIPLSDNAALRVLYAEDVRREENESSLILQLTYGEKSFIFMGDSEISSENVLLDKYPDLKADWIKVGHHGSNSSSSKLFVNRLMPEFAAFSCGTSNPPDKEVLDRFQKIGCKISRTDIEGSLLFSSDGKTITVQTEN